MGPAVRVIRSPQSGFRPDIEGMRGIAVLLVAARMIPPRAPGTGKSIAM